MPLTQLLTQVTVSKPNTPIRQLVGTLESESKQEDHLPWIQSWGGAVSLGAMIFGWLAQFVYGYWKQPFLVFFALGALALGAVGVVIYALAGARTLWRDLKRFDHELLASVADRASERYKLAQRIGHDFDVKQIRFARDYLQSVCANIRGRVGLLTGALEKVGVIPLAASAVIAFIKTSAESSYATAWYTAAAGLGLIYMLSIKMLGSAHTVERCIVILNHAEVHAEHRMVSIVKADTKGSEVRV